MPLYHVAVKDTDVERLIDAKTSAKARRLACESIVVTRAKSEDTFRLARSGINIEWADCAPPAVEQSAAAAAAG